MDPEDWLAHWRNAQSAFWSAAAEQGVESAADFASPDWQPFDDLASYALAAAAPEGQGHAFCRVKAAVAAYRDIIQQTFDRVHQAFAVQCRAIHTGGGAVPDWRLYRDRWFDIAEVEFIRTLRTPDYLDAQLELLRSAVALWRLLPDGVQTNLRDQRRLNATAQQTLVKLGAEMVPIAQTPKDLVWQDGRTTLWRYRPFGATRPTLGPVLICHGLIGRQTMTDLRPERSLVRNLLAAGVEVLVVDWGDAGPEDADLGLDHFVTERIPAVIQAALGETGAESLVLFGICQGGTLAACYAAHSGVGLRGLITAVAPFDFDADRYDADPSHGLLHVWARSLEDDDIDDLIGLDGNLSGEFAGLIFNQINPVRTLAKYAVEMLESAGDPGGITTFLAMENWLSDRPDMPGALARSWLVDFYRRNGLINGELLIAGRPVLLSEIETPVLNIFATADHIIPGPCSRALGAALFGKDYTELALPTGHVGAFVSARSQSLLGPAIVSWLSR